MEKPKTAAILALVLIALLLYRKSMFKPSILLLELKAG